VPKEPVKQI